MTLRVRSWMALSIASASLFLAHCGGDDTVEDAGSDATADASDAHASHDATMPTEAGADATLDATVDATGDATGDANDASTQDVNAVDANLGDANDAGTDAASDGDAGSADANDANDASDASDANMDDDASDGDVADAAVDTGCGPAYTLQPVDAGVGPKCPFANPEGGIVTCAFGETCCEPASGSSSSICASTCPALDGGTQWECQDPSSCPTGDVCCAITTGAGQDPGCPTHFLNKFKGTACRTACQAGEIYVCESQAQCAEVTGSTCQVTHGKGLPFGLCL